MGQIPGLSFYEFDLSQESNWQYVILRIDSQCSPLSRDELVEVLHAENILVRKYFTPGFHRMAPYRDHFDCRSARLPVTERLATELIALPTGTGVSLDDILEIALRLRSGLEKAAQVREAIAARRLEAKNRLPSFIPSKAA